MSRGLTWVGKLQTIWLYQLFRSESLELCRENSCSMHCTVRHVTDGLLNDLRFPVEIEWTIILQRLRRWWHWSQQRLKFAFAFSVFAAAALVQGTGVPSAVVCVAASLCERYAWSWRIFFCGWARGAVVWIQTESAPERAWGIWRSFS